MGTYLGSDLMRVSYQVGGYLGSDFMEVSYRNPKVNNVRSFGITYVTLNVTLENKLRVRTNANVHTGT